MSSRSTGGRRWPQFLLLAVVALAAAALVVLALFPRQTPDGAVDGPALTIAGSAAPSGTASSAAAPGASGGAPAGLGLSVAFIGDSYTEGVGATDPSLRWSTLLAKANGWNELNFGVGGSSYGAGIGEATSYDVQVAEAIEVAPDVVVVSGGLNMAQFDQALGVESVFAELREALPDARIIALSPFWVGTAYPEQLRLTADEVKSQVTAVGGQYIDLGHLFEEEFQYFEIDGLHPDDAGHQLIANSVDAGLPVEIGG